MDNNTWNNSHIALVGKAMSSNESAAYEIMTELDVDYVRLACTVDVVLISIPCHYSIQMRAQSYIP